MPKVVFYIPTWWWLAISKNVLPQSYNTNPRLFRYVHSWICFTRNEGKWLREVVECRSTASLNFCRIPSISALYRRPPLRFIFCLLNSLCRGFAVQVKKCNLAWTNTTVLKKRSECFWNHVSQKTFWPNAGNLFQTKYDVWHRQAGTGALLQLFHATFCC